MQDSNMYITRRRRNTVFVIIGAAAFLGYLPCICSFSATSSNAAIRQSTDWKSRNSLAYYTHSRSKTKNLYQSPPKRDSTPVATENETAIWNMPARKVMASLAALGAVETGYLSYVKLWGDGDAGLANICTSTGSTCGSVLQSPYASIANIPLTAFGFAGEFIYGDLLALEYHVSSCLNQIWILMFAAYSLVLLLALFPILNNDNKLDDGVNRIALVTLTTAMGTFSTYLLSLILFVIKSSCTFCFISAALSISLALIAWSGGFATFEGLQQKTKTALMSSGASFVITTAAALSLYYINSDVGESPYSSFRESASSSLTLASTLEDLGTAPPAISTTSSERALQLAASLQSLNTKFFGAYWCSHCYDQKQTMGYEAMQQIPYIECAKDGFQSQSSLCKATKIPGYPTWQINGKLFPGEQSLDELEEIVRDLIKSQ